MFFNTNNVALRAQRDFADGGAGVGRVLLDEQHDLGNKRVDVHDLHGIADLLLGVLAKRVGYRHLASGDGNAHSDHLLPRGE